MDSEVKSVWVNALRSGEYVQGRGSLYEAYEDSPPCHCALGVLAEECVKSGVITVDPLAKGNDRFGDIDNERLLPSPVVHWADFGDFNDEELEIMRLNDNPQGLAAPFRYHTFDEIADYIEENF